MRTTALLSLFVLVMAIACKKEDTKPGDPAPTGYTPTCSGTAPKFAANVSPIIFNECATAGCHGSGSTYGPGELLTYTQIKSASARIRSAVVSQTMPKDEDISDEKRNMIVCWIDAGANDD